MTDNNKGYFYIKSTINYTQIIDILLTDCFKSQRLDSLQANVVHLRTQGPLVYKMCLKKEFEKEKEVMLKLPDIFLEQPKPLQLSPKKTYPEVNLESHREKVILLILLQSFY